MFIMEVNYISHINIAFTCYITQFSPAYNTWTNAALMTSGFPFIIVLDTTLSPISVKEVILDDVYKEGGTVFNYILELIKN